MIERIRRRVSVVATAASVMRSCARIILSIGDFEVPSSRLLQASETAPGVRALTWSDIICVVPIIFKVGSAGSIV